MRIQSIFFAALALTLFVVSGFAQSNVIDTLMQGKEYKLPPLDTSLRSKSSGFKSSETEQANTKDYVYMVQFDALADFDAAQSRRADLQRRTGLTIQLVFDSPFYKLRGGSFTKKEDAEDQVRQFAENNIQSLVVKVQINKN